MKKIDRSILGVWYDRQPRRIRKQFMADAYAKGISPSRIRGWFYHNIVPSVENMEVMEELTGIKLEQLFPY